MGDPHPPWRAGPLKVQRVAAFHPVPRQKIRGHRDGVFFREPFAEIPIPFLPGSRLKTQQSARREGIDAGEAQRFARVIGKRDHRLDQRRGRDHALRGLHLWQRGIGNFPPDLQIGSPGDHLEGPVKTPDRAPVGDRDRQKHRDPERDAEDSKQCRSRPLQHGADGSAPAEFPEIGAAPVHQRFSAISVAARNLRSRRKSAVRSSIFSPVLVRR